MSRVLCKYTECCQSRYEPALSFSASAEILRGEMDQPSRQATEAKLRIDADRDFLERCLPGCGSRPIFSRVAAAYL
jgi:hypothetical protein